MKFYRPATDGLTLTLRVTPRASRDRITGTMDFPEGKALKVSVTAPADRGKANIAVCELLARTFHVAKSAVLLLSGEADRRKVVRIQGRTPALLAVAQQWNEP